MKVAVVIVVLALTTLSLSTARPANTYKYMKWLESAGYYDGSHGDVENMSDHRMAKAMAPALKKMKQFYDLGNDDELDSTAMAQMDLPRCGNKDIEDPSGQGGFQSLPTFLRRRKRQIQFLGAKENKWRTMPVTVGFKNYSPSMSKAVQDEVAMGCARKWAELSGLSFRLEKNAVPNIHIEFGPIQGDNGPGGIVGFSYSPAPFRTPPTTSLKLDSREPWKAYQTSRQGGLSLEDTLCHEMGHTLGLGHSDQRSSIMYPTVGFRTVNTVFGPDDKYGIQVLYRGPNGITIVGGGSPPPQPTPPGPTSPRPTPPGPTPPGPTQFPPPNDPCRRYLNRNRNRYDYCRCQVTTPGQCNPDDFRHRRRG